ncbi:putative MFS family arabinose efflux permease [Pararhizobium capsulatum DSM 1112]|uniref:MFS family arabinose efflux permease n=1 Tax=Pararhizobium capsulatum DSM 1112 TaxID=1121113 RepID=A0ABU0BVI6_9HYPH|nr:MFS transporter [Pararhizobium capsulatum]MDQ0322261.1 putative MFS family arabinose efflux permease [Pararhizobium capsulatum DSM 1112]
MDGLVTNSASAKEEDHAARWGAVVSLSLGVFGLVTAEFLPASLLTPMSADLGVSIGTAGQSVTATAIVAAIAGPAVVVGTGRFDRKLVLLALTGLLVISSLMAGFASNLATLLAARVLLGIALGGFWAMSLALAMRLVPGRLMPRAMAIVMSGVSIATVCAAPLGAWIGATLGWRYAFLLAAAVGVVTFAVQALTVPPLPPVGRTGLDTIVRVLKRPAIRLGLATILLVVTGHFAGFTYIRPYLELVPRFDVEMITAILLAFGIGGFFGNIAGGFLAERSTRMAITLAASGIAITALTLATAGALPGVAAAATAAWGFAFGALPVSVQSFISRAAGDEAEGAGAATLTTFQIAISTGAILGGLIVEFQGPAGVFLFSSFAALLGASLVAVSRKMTLQAS